MNVDLPIKATLHWVTVDIVVWTQFECEKAPVVGSYLNLNGYLLACIEKHIIKIHFFMCQSKCITSFVCPDDDSISICSPNLMFPWTFIPGITADAATTAILIVLSLKKNTMSFFSGKGTILGTMDGLKIAPSSL